MTKGTSHELEESEENTEHDLFGHSKLAIDVRCVVSMFCLL